MKLLEPLTKASLRLDSTAALPELEALLDLALADPMGPVYLEVTGAGLRSEVLPRPSEYRAAGAAVSTSAHSVAQVDAARHLLASASRPVVIAGLQTRDERVSRSLRGFVHRLQCPVLTTWKGKGSVADDDPLVVCHYLGGPGEEPGKFKTCHGIALDLRHEKPLLFVCNRNNNRVEHWDLDGNFVRILQKDLRMPAAVHIRGDYALVPELQGRVTVLNKDGSIAAQLGDNPNEKHRANYGLAQDQWVEGICNSPHGGSIDHEGNLIVSEWSQFGRLHKFARKK